MNSQSESRFGVLSYSNFDGSARINKRIYLVGSSGHTIIDPDIVNANISKITQGLSHTEFINFSSTNADLQDFQVITERLTTKPGDTVILGITPKMLWRDKEYLNQQANEERELIEILMSDSVEYKIRRRALAIVEAINQKGSNFVRYLVSEIATKSQYRGLCNSKYYNLSISSEKLKMTADDNFKLLVQLIQKLKQARVVPVIMHGPIDLDKTNDSCDKQRFHYILNQVAQIGRDENIEVMSNLVGLDTNWYSNPAHISRGTKFQTFSVDLAHWIVSHSNSLVRATK